MTRGKRNDASCLAIGCEVRAWGKGLCQRHYTRLRRHDTTELSAPTEDEVDAELKLAIFGYDPDENYPDFGCASMREAYRAGWEDGRNA